ncbi:RHS repeat-associated protein [Breznakia blatticola]|uniref:RHS repeat-associated protein n=1 Tax=Breznakia blatticola TaxID=1754012 RepID=A0A4R7ZB28_9FIRM|nr:DUF6531 domain-containing protein [Breznakia blatticola]TDW14693.1 RHS repeat-associated protein [Breznakia blatticola]
MRKKLLPVFLVCLMLLQVSDTGLRVLAAQSNRITPGASYGSMYQKDIQREIVNVYDANDDAQEEAVVTKEASNYDLSDPYESYEEVEDKREINSKTYEIQKGVFVKETYFEPIHKEENGKLVDIDDRLENVNRSRSNKAIYKSKDGLLDVQIDGNSVRVTNEETSDLQWSLPDADVSHYSVKENVILFTNVYKNIDMEYVIRSNKVFTTFYINGPVEKSTLDFIFTSQHLTSKETDDGVVFYRSDNPDQDVYVFAKPTIRSATEAIGNSQITYENAQDGVHVSLSLDQTWINDSAQVYPIALSTRAANLEVLNITSCYVRSETPNFSSSQYSDLFVGYDNEFWAGIGVRTGVNRSYFYIDKPNLGNNMRVEKANLELFKEQDGIEQGVSHLMGKNIEAYECANANLNTLTWNTQPTIEKKLSTNNVEGVKNKYYKFDITGYVSSRYKGIEKTLLLKAEDESINAFANVFNSESTASRPRITIEYREDYDVDPNLSIENFDQELRVVSKLNDGFKALSLDGLIKPYATAVFKLHEKQDGNSTVINELLSMSVGGAYFSHPIVFTNPYGSGHTVQPSYNGNKEGQNYTTNYVKAESIPKFDTLYEYVMKVKKDGVESAKSITTDGFIKYKVKNGDTLRSIASYYGVSIDQIKLDNNQSSNSVYAGQVLFIRFKKDNTKVPKDVYTPPLRTITYEAKYVYRGPQCYGTCPIGDPITTTNGNFYYETEDFTLKDYDAFTFHRYYNSTGEQVSNMFGNGFTSNLEQYVTYDENKNILFFRGDGKILQIDKTANGYTPKTTDRIEIEVKQDEVQIFDIETGRTYVFDSYGTLVTIIEKTGHKTTISYDAYGAIQSIRVGEKEISFTYNENNLVQSIQLPNGKSVSYTYDAKRNLTSYTNVLGHKETYNYDDKNFMRSIIDKNGNTIATNTYDDEGKVKSQKDGKGQEMKFSYTNKKTDITLADNTKVTYEHEDFKTTKVAYGDGSSSSYRYDTYGNIIEKIDEDQNKTTYTYDKHDLLEIAYPDGTTESYTYNSAHQVTSKTGRDGGVEYFAYQGNDLVKHTLADGTFTTYTYDANHRVVTETSATGASKTYTYSGNQIASITHSNGLVENFTYDASGNVLKESDNQGKNQTYLYNDNNQMIKKTYTDGTYEEWGYDGNGNITSYRDRIGGITTNTYDKNNNVIASKKGSLTNSKVYDSNNQCIKETDAQGITKTYTYDAKLRLIKESDGLGNEISYTYDALDHVIKTIDVRGQESTDTYDQDLLIKHVDAAGLETTYSYDDKNREIEKAYTNGTKESKVYTGLLLTEESDIRGQKTTYTYDAYSRIKTKTVSIGEIEHVTTYTYDSNNNITKEDVDGVVTTYAYDVYNRKIKETDPLGFTTSYTYNFDDEIISTTDALGNTSTQTYDGEGNLIKETDKNGNTVEHVYNAQGFLVAEKDALGNTTTYAYNEKGQCITVVDPYGFTTSFTYSKYNQLLDTYQEGTLIESITYNKYGDVKTKKNTELNESYTYDHFGRQVTKTDQYTQLQTTTSYDVYGNVTKEEDSNGRSSSFTYDVYNQKLTEIDAYGRTTSYTYDQLGQVISTTNAQGTTSQVYDKNGNVIESISPLGVSTTYAYNKRNEKIKEVIGDKELAYSYDGLGQLTKTTDVKRKSETTTSYDANGNVTKEVDALGNAITYTYDAKNQKVSTTDALGNTSKTEYDANGNVTKEIDALGNTKQSSYNAYQQLEKEVDARGFETLYSYDDALRLVKVEDAIGGSITYIYNDANKVSKETNSEGFSKTFVYDDYGQIIEESDYNGVITKRSYDVLGNVVKETTANKTTTSVYDEKGNHVKTSVNDVVQEQFTYNDYNQVATKKDGNSNVTTYTYDTYGNVSTEDAAGYKTAYTYNVYGELLEKVENDTYKESYVYDAKNQLTETKVNGKTAQTKTYDANGNIIQEAEYGKVIETQYDACNRPSAYLVEYEGSMQVIQSVTYDESGNAITITDANGNTEQRTFDANGNETSFINKRGIKQLFAYDTLGQLEKAENAQGRVVRYTYDGNGNALTKTVGTKMAVYTYDDFNQCTYEKNEYGYVEKTKYDVFGNKVEETKPDGTIITYAYDNNNNQIQKNSQTFSYDKRNNLIKAEGANGTITYTYDAFDQMLTSTNANKETVSYAYNKDKQLSKMTYANKDVVTYSYKDGMLSTVKKNDATIATYSYNNRGELVDLVQGNMQSTFAYDKLGNVIKQDIYKDKKLEQSRTYAYDANDNVVKEVIDGKENNYVYNDADELSESSKYVDGKLVKTSYTYDMYGNKRVSSNDEGVKTYTYNDKNQLESVESTKGVSRYYYNDNGNLTSKVNSDGSKEVYTYDEFDHLVEHQKGDYIYTFAYDAQGDKISESKQDVRTYQKQVWYDYEGVIDVTASSDTKVKNTFDGLRQQVKTKEANGGVCTYQGTSSYTASYKKDVEVTDFVLDKNVEYTQILETNGNGNVYGLSILEEDGTTLVASLNDSIALQVKNNKVTKLTYSDYGKTSNIAQSHAYNGEYQQETGLIYLRARYYDPTIGNFIQIDRNYKGENTDVATQNRYNYALSNPYKYVDRDGNKAKKKKKQSVVSAVVGSVKNVVSSIKTNIVQSTTMVMRSETMYNLMDLVVQISPYFTSEMAKVTTLLAVTPATTIGLVMYGAVATPASLICGIEKAIRFTEMTPTQQQAYVNAWEHQLGGRLYAGPYVADKMMNLYYESMGYTTRIPEKAQVKEDKAISYVSENSSTGSMVAAAQEQQQPKQPKKDDDDDKKKDKNKNSDKGSNSNIKGNDVTYNQRSVDKAFGKHGSDFGNYPDGSKGSIQQYQNDISKFIDSPNNIQKPGTWWGSQGTHIYNPTTNQWVFINADGTFNTGFKLSADQMKYLIETGVVK